MYRHRDLPRRRGVARCVDARPAALARACWWRRPWSSIRRSHSSRARCARSGRAESAWTCRWHWPSRPCTPPASSKRCGAAARCTSIRFRCSCSSCSPGRYLEMRARHRARDLTDALARLTPPFADRQRRRRNAATRRHPRAARRRLRARRRRRHRAGRRRAADRALPRGRSAAQRRVRAGDEAPRRPADRGQRARRWAGTACASSASARTPRSRESPRSSAARMPHVRGCRWPAKRAAGRFVARVLALTALTAVAWAVVDPARAFAAAIAVLVISCPCAFALAVPAALTRALAALARRGVLVVKPDAIQALAECTHALFDKTGTLTEATLSLADVQTFDGMSRDEALRMAATLARQSRHPVARAIAAAHPGHAGRQRVRRDHRTPGSASARRSPGVRCAWDAAISQSPASRSRASTTTPCCSPMTQADRRLPRERATAARCLRRDRCTAVRKA